MAIFKDSFRDWQKFWGEVIRMWARQHGLNLSLIWKLSPLIAIIGIIGIFAFPEPWRSISYWILGLGAFVLFFSLCFIFPYKKWAEDTKELREQIDSLSPLVEIEKQQHGNEGDWLHLVVEMIDLGRRTNRPEKEITVRFQIDSGLVYDFKPYHMWVSPVLGGWEPSEPQLEIRQPACILFLKLARCILSRPGGKIGLTGSGEVHNPLGSLKLPRRLDCLPALRWPALGNWGCH